MSNYYGYFEDINGKTACLAGVVSTLSDETLNKIIPRFWAVQADVFETDKEGLVSSIKKRLSIYNRDSKEEYELLDDFNFEIEECESDFGEILNSLFTSYKAEHSDEEKEYTDEFLKELHFHLGDIESIYRLKKPLGDKSERCFSSAYTYVVFDIIFIQYSGYMVMVVLGSDE